MRRAITARTRALMPVHFAGGPCDMDAIERIADEHGLRMIEDAAHAVEADVRGRRKIGSIGDFTCFSLYATKSLAGGEGGIITTASDAAAERLRLLRAQGITRDPWRRAQTHTLGHYDVDEPGYKANLADLHAAAALPRSIASSASTPTGPTSSRATTRGWRSWTGSPRSGGRRTAATPTTSTCCGSTRPGPAPTATATPRR